MTQVQLAINGMHCASCVHSIETSLSQQKGIYQATVNFASEQILIEFNPSHISSDDIIQHIETIGYTAYHPSSSDDKQPEHHSLTPKVLWSTLFSLIVVGLPFSPLPEAYNQWGTLICSTIVLFYCGSSLLYNTWHAWCRKTVVMDSLIVLGAGSVYTYSTLLTIVPTYQTLFELDTPIYYHSVVLLITFILGGRLIEQKAKHQAFQSLSSLLTNQPPTASLIHHGHEIATPIADIAAGDYIHIRPGDSISLDGIIEEGKGTLDESMMTGEPLPQEKASGDLVISGSINTVGHFVYRVTATMKESFIQQLTQLVIDTQNTRAPIQRLADEICRFFIPFVLVLALLSAVIWCVIPPGWESGLPLMTFIAVLVIACPCALGLATPMAIMVASHRAAKHHILIKHSDCFERCETIDTIVFDKTGTLTTGQFHVADVVLTKTMTLSKNQFIQRCASLEHASEHPLAKAIVHFAMEKHLSLLPVQQFVSHHGQGVSGIVQEQSICIGKQTLMNQATTNGFQPLQADIESFLNKGHTVLLVSIDEAPAGVIALQDTLREDTGPAIDALKHMGLTPIMMTGDNAMAAHHVAQAIGIDVVVSDLLPEEKQQHIQALQGRGKTVAMVGDGTNDAPALAQADLAIAIGAGTDIAISCSDVVLVPQRLDAVVTLFHLSQHTLRIIRQNLGFALLYNTLCIPIAAGVLYPLWGILLTPWVAAIAMSLSSLSVVYNSLRLNKSRLATTSGF